MLGQEWVISGDDKVIDIIAWCDIDILLLLHISKASGNINIDGTPLRFILKQQSNAPSLYTVSQVLTRAATNDYFHYRQICRLF